MTFYNTTWVTHNSRISDRMIKNRVKVWEPFFMDLEIRKKVLFFLNEKIWIMQQQAKACRCVETEIEEQQAKACRCGKSLDFKVLALNVLSDHVHIIIESDEENITGIIRNLKWYSSFMLSRYLKLSEKWEWKQIKIWAKYGSKTFIRDEKHLNSSIEYVLNNHLKHEVESVL